MSRSLFLLALLLLKWSGAAHAQNVPWASTLAGSGGATSVADAQGNLYVSGLHTGPLTTPAGTLSGDGAYVAKYDSAGQAQWLRPIQYTGNYRPDFILMASARPEHVFSTGQGESGTRFNGTHSLTGFNSYITSYRADGSIRWLHEFALTGVPDPSNPNSPLLLIPKQLLADTLGNAYLIAVNYTQDYDSLFTVDNIVIPNPQRYGQGFVVKLDSTGNTQWVVPIYGGSGDWAGINNAVVDRGGNLFLNGIMQSTPLEIYSATGIHTTVSPTNFAETSYILKFTPAGEFAWYTNIHAVPATSTTAALGYFTLLTIDPRGNLYASGIATDTIHLSGQVSDQPPGQGAMFISKFNTNGQAQWLHAYKPSDFYNEQSLDGALAYAPQGFLYLDKVGPGMYGDQIFTSLDTRLLLAIDTLGQTMWTMQMPDNTNWLAGGFAGGTSVDAAGNAYQVRNADAAAVAAGVGGNAITAQGAYVLKISPRATRVSGIVYVDQNANGLRDPAEVAFPRPVMVSDPQRGKLSFSSAATGQYRLYGPPGAYTAEVNPPPAYYQVVQGAAGYTGALATPGLTATDRDFGLTPVANQPDLRLSLTPYTPARRGFVTRYRARLENMGTTTIASGQVSATLDPTFQIIGGVPTPTQQTGQTLTWDFQSLAPFAVRDYDLVLSVPVGTPLGTQLTSSAVVTPTTGDLTPADNQETLPQTVIGSFDPNDITVSHTLLSPTQVTAGHPIDYTIRFENMGTDTAFSVIVQDTLPVSMLDINSFSWVSQSHNCHVDLTQEGLLTIRFDHIRLPYRAIDALGSQGFVRFRITPKRSLVLGDLIHDKAHIYFDFNPAVVTNTATTRIGLPTGLLADPAGTAAGSLYPNPATNRVTFTAEVPVAGPVTVQLLDALGRPVQAAETRLAPAGPFQHTLDLRGVVPGLYAVRLTLPGGATLHRRLVVSPGK